MNNDTISIDKEVFLSRIEQSEKLQAEHIDTGVGINEGEDGEPGEIRGYTGATGTINEPWYARYVNKRKKRK